MISDAKIEKALDYLINSSTEIGALVEQARFAEHFVKHVEALQMKASNEEALGAQQRNARASEKYLEALTADAKATAALRETMAKREAMETLISAWQTMIKAQQGPRP